MNELISIIIPVYNLERFLPRCMESLVGQSYPNLEIVLVDDGSTDNSGIICDEWKQRDKRVVVIHQENKGVSEARNAGIEISRGEYLGFVDGDDWCEPEMYELLLGSVKEADSDIAMCGYYDYPNGINHPVEKGVMPLEPCSCNDAIIPVMRYKGYFTSLWNKIFERKIIFNNSERVLMDTSLGYGEDEVWLLRILSKANRISFVPEPLYHWRPRTGSATRAKELTEQQMSLLDAKRQVLKMIQYDRGVKSFARGRTFNDCHILKVDAYCSSDRGHFEEVSEFLKPLKRDWIISKDVRVVRKIKVMILEMLMMAGAPVRIVKLISDKR